VWVAPEAIATKGGSVNKGGNAQFVSTHSRLMTDVHARTHDPLYLVVPSRLTTIGFGAKSKPIPGTRSVGMVYNYLPWLIAALHQNGDPAADPQLEVVARSETIELQPGGVARVGFAVRNTGTQPIEDARASFQMRLDYAVTVRQPLPARLGPGDTAECSFEVQAPAQVNLSCAYNSIAYGHWCALYRRAGRAQLAHRVTRVTLQDR
jgi:hypothetical protein